MMNEVVAGKYELLKEVGRGASSRVYLARDIRLNKNWAVKRFLKEGLFNGYDFQSKLLVEAELMKNLDHPALPRIVDIIEENDAWYIVMDYVEGETMKSYLSTYGPCDQKQAVSWGLEILSVLTYLHSQDPPVIYRDMKPGNIIVQPSGSLKVIDFGIARTYKTGKNEDTAALGTAAYAAPEQFDKGDGQACQTDQRTDIYNFGVTLYVMLTNKVPRPPYYALQPVRQIAPGTSAGIEYIIEKCTQPEPADRFQSAAETAEALFNYEKFDESYISKQYSIIKKAILPGIIGSILILLSLAMFITDSVVSSGKYDTLIASTGNIEKDIDNLHKAISIKPSDVRGYELLVEKYAENGISEKESEDILSVYNENAAGLSERSDAYADINFTLGEAYLVYYEGSSDSSVRNKILAALPFFEHIVSSSSRDHKNYDTAEIYCNIGRFYKNNIVNDSFFTKEITKTEYSRLMNDFTKTVNLLKKKETSNDQKMITASLIVSILENKLSDIIACTDGGDIRKLVSSIEKILESMDTTNVQTDQERMKLMKRIAELSKTVDTRYLHDERMKEVANDDG